MCVCLWILSERCVVGAKEQVEHIVRHAQKAKQAAGRDQTPLPLTVQQ